MLFAPLLVGFVGIGLIMPRPRTDLGRFELSVPYLPTSTRCQKRVKRIILYIASKFTTVAVPQLETMIFSNTTKTLKRYHSQNAGENIIELCNSARVTIL